MFANWTDLILFGDKVNALRTPTSDINITIGMALVVFVVTHIEGVRALGFGGYVGKFINLSGFKRGLANGVIDLYVGLIELLLEFFKPVTLAFRLFGNLYGGGIMLGVFTALIIAFVPIPFLALEGFIGFIQALIFASLTLMYILTATESHHTDAHEARAFGDEPEGNMLPTDAGAAAAGAGH
jgi:F-type H+-transporting ATPase subunit a